MEGSDLTVASAGLMVHRAMRVAEKLRKEGISVEVVDLRTLVPLDEETLSRSVKKTGRLLILDEDYMSYGMTGEVTFRVQSRALRDLKAPIQRLAVPDVPIPFSEPLEKEVIPGEARIEAKIREMVS